MDNSTKQLILALLYGAKDLTIATIRPDGYPQATTVSYANDGMTIYFGIGKNSQKAHNIRQNNKVSLTVNAPYKDWHDIRGLSVGGVAEILQDLHQIRHASDCMVKRFPELLQWTGPERADDLLLVAVHPQVISVLDYTKGFGHTELVQL